MNDQQNRFYDELVAILSSDHLSDMLGWMAVHSQSVILNYGEDNQMWECSWIISSGKRFTGVREGPLDAIRDSLNLVRNEMLFPPEKGNEYLRRIEGEWVSGDMNDEHLSGPMKEGESKGV